MGDTSVIVVTGNLTRDPEQRQLAGGRTLVSFDVACSRYSRKEKVERPTFYKVTIWQEREQAWIMSRAQRGTAVTVTGEYDQSPRDDGKGVFNDISNATIKLQHRLRETAPRPEQPDLAVDLDDDIPF